MPINYAVCNVRRDQIFNFNYFSHNTLYEQTLRYSKTINSADADCNMLAMQSSRFKYTI
jgi:phage regulator Rha-like protein